MSMNSIIEIITYFSAFLMATGVITFCGSRLSKYGDIIAEKLGLSRTWIGVILLATVTSLPELITGISSVTYADVPDIALGDILGSCVFNLLILAFLDMQFRGSPVTSLAHHGHILSASLGILLFIITALSLFLKDKIFPLGWIGPYTLIFILTYFIGVKMIYIYEKRQFARYIKEKAIELKYEEISTKKAIIHYAINGFFVIITAIFLPIIGEGLAEATGLGQSFIGTIFIAMTTSLPEVVVTLSAAKIGAIDLAIGNLFGSNLFNIFILGIDDIFYVKGPLLYYVNENHIISALSASAMTSVAIMGLIYRAEKKKFFIAWDSLIIIMLYLINMMLLYTLR